MSSDNEDQKIIKRAKNIIKNSHSPYSDFKVGAAVLTNHNNIFAGCNIENASYGLTVCAERTAIFKSVSNGEKYIKKIAVYINSDDHPKPCGSCRQVMYEFNPNMKILLASSGKSSVMNYQIKDLLTNPFGPEDLGIQRTWL